MRTDSSRAAVGGAGDVMGTGTNQRGARTEGVQADYPLGVAALEPAEPPTAAARPPTVPALAPEDLGQAERRQLTVMFCDLTEG